MKKLIKAYERNWFVPIIFVGLFAILGLLTITIHNKIALYLSVGLPFLALLGSGITGIIRFINKNYKTGLLQIVFTRLMGIVVFYLFSFYLMFYPYDYYEYTLKIPDNIEIHVPRSEPMMYSASYESQPVNNPKHMDILLYNSFQPGLYTYAIWLSKIDSGKIFLKAYEITKNDNLSEKTLPKESEINVGNSTDTLIKYKIDDQFKIYEGDKGKPYAARFEVWYIENDSNKEVKLLEKNYKIEGWQR